MMRKPEPRTTQYGMYGDWRQESLTRSWTAFSDSHVVDKDVLDFGCGDGQLSFFLAGKKPRTILGIDLNPEAIQRCRLAFSQLTLPPGVEVRFEVGFVDRLPAPDASIDTIVAFDCLEHVMAPAAILKEWYRVLRPGGNCLVEWFPYKGPWGPHTEALIPIPWAHILFGEEALFRAAERIYDLPEFIPRHWDLDDQGKKKPNKWRAWSSFKEQGYINKLSLKTLRELALQLGFQIHRSDLNSFGGSPAKKFLGRTLMRMPTIGEYFVSFVQLELRRPIEGRGD
jgi:SAM-dependent methyltransferase